MSLSSPSSSSPAAAVPLAAPVGILQLERFLETVLKQSLREVLVARDGTRTMVAQCVQLRSLFGEMRNLSRERTILHDGGGGDGTSEVSGAAYLDSEGVASGKGQVAGRGSSSSSGSRGDGGGLGRRMRNRLLVDLGNHFYAPAIVKDAGHVHVNIGCGVVLDMSLPEADQFLRRREEVLKHIAMNQTREALRLMYRIRLVTEAIARLNERQMGLRQ